MKRIVLIDDDKDDAELFREALEEANSNAELQHFANAREALTALQAWQEALPNLIFLDINLPIMNGWEFLVCLNELAVLSAIPVMMYTTSSLKREKEIARDLGAIGFITKPNDYKELKSILEDLLNKEDLQADKDAFFQH